jgi:hypothetical protein
MKKNKLKDAMKKFNISGILAAKLLEMRPHNLYRLVRSDRGVVTPRKDNSYFAMKLLNNYLIWLDQQKKKVQFYLEKEG